MYVLSLDLPRAQGVRGGSSSAPPGGGGGGRVDTKVVNGGWGGGRVDGSVEVE